MKTLFFDTDKIDKIITQNGKAGLSETVKMAHDTLDSGGNVIVGYDFTDTIDGNKKWQTISTYYDKASFDNWIDRRFINPPL